jgi:multiple RNA-binding domain-containing protein 1
MSVRRPLTDDPSSRLEIEAFRSGFARPMAAAVVTTEVHVSNINYRTTAQLLGKAFAKYGEVTNARIIVERDRWGSERSAGFGFVEFKTADAATAAAAADPPLVVDGRSIRVRPARPRAPRKRDTIHVAGIPKGTTQDDLRAVFGKYSPVEIRIVRENSDDWRGFAFIQFDSEENQTAAHKANRVFQLKGEESRVQFARRSLGAAARFRRPRGPARAQAEEGARPERTGPRPPRGGARRAPDA